MVILGDLNAACSYITIKGFRAVRLRSDPKFRWLIGDEQDTTVRQKTHCAYDRSVTPDNRIIVQDLDVCWYMCSVCLSVGEASSSSYCNHDMPPLSIRHTPG